LLKDHQLQRVNTPGENLCIQLEEWDNLSQIFSLKKEPVHQSSSTGLMEMVLDLKRMISSTILLETLMRILRNSIKTSPTSLELQLTPDMTPPLMVITISADLKLQVTELKSKVYQVLFKNYNE